MEATQEIQHPEPVPEDNVPNNEPMQTSQTPADDGKTNSEQPQEDAVMAEAAVCALSSFVFDYLLASCPAYIRMKKQ